MKSAACACCHPYFRPITPVVASVMVLACWLLAPLTARAITTQGVLPGNETWTGNVTIEGDVTVPAGVTLTIAPGATVSFAGSDSMGSGVDTSRVELIVNGTLTAPGTSGSGIALKNSSVSWYGVRLEAGSSATFNYVTLSGAQYGIYGKSTFSSRTGR